MLRHGHFSRSFQASFAAMEVVAAAAAQWLWRTSHSGQMIMILHTIGIQSIFGFPKIKTFN